MGSTTLDTPGVNLVSPETARFLEETSDQRAGFRQRWKYYYQDNATFFRKFTESGKATLIIGLDALKLAEELREGTIYVLELGSGPHPAPSNTRIEYVTSIEEAFRKGVQGSSCVRRSKIGSHLDEEPLRPRARVDRDEGSHRRLHRP